MLSSRYSPGTGKSERRTGKTPTRVKERYGNARNIGGNRVVFDIKGNSYRLVAEVDYTHRTVRIRFVGTHDQYAQDRRKKDIDMADIKPIRTEADYERTLARIDELMGSEYGSPEGDELDVLVTLVESWEDEHYPIGYPEPHEAIKFRMEQAGLNPRDLVPIIGSRAKVSEVLSGKRAITMPMARALHEHLGIPADVLLRKLGTESFESPADIDPQRYPIKKMAKLGWIKEGSESKYSTGELIAEMIHKAGGDKAPATYRVNDSQRVNAKTDPLCTSGLVLAGHGPGQRQSYGLRLRSRDRHPRVASGGCPSEQLGKGTTARPRFSGRPWHCSRGGAASTQDIS